jgi:integrase
LTWDEVDVAGGVIRLSPTRSKTKVGRLLPISRSLKEVLDRRATRRLKADPLVFKRDGVTVRRWKVAWRDACQNAGVPGRIFHDCRRTAARNLIRAGVGERIAMLLTGRKTRCVFDRYNIVNDRFERPTRFGLKANVLAARKFVHNGFVTIHIGHPKN